MKKCGVPCLACPYIKEGKSISAKKFTWSINKEVSCYTSNVVYMLECDKERCRQRYIGETAKEVSYRILQHIGYVRNNIINRTTGNHFNLPGHSIHNMKFTIIEKVKSSNEFYRKEREKYHINKFNTYYEGINRVI